GGNWIGGVTPANNLTTDSITFNSAPVTYQPSLNTTHSVLGVTLTGGTTFSGSGTLIVGASGMSATALEHHHLEQNPTRVKLDLFPSCHHYLGRWNRHRRIGSHSDDRLDHWAKPVQRSPFGDRQGYF
ncbi:MAG: hypothetical protein KA250_12245, partial [Verrucomicrobiales bacterium]|nr:hypothetical protein [Verrucomicrobiales bacterium]